MKNLINAIRNEKLTRLEEFKKEINDFKHAELLEQCGRYRRFSSLIPKGKDLTKFTAEELKAYLIEREQKQVYKDIEVKANDVKTVFGAGKLISVKIQIEWVRSRTWGANPKGEMWVYFENKEGNRESAYFQCGGIGGCGYDKTSTATANLLNQSIECLKPLFVKKNKATDKHNHELLGYGAGYGLLPRFEGGVGVNCHKRIFEALGYKFETTASGKNFDAYMITKK